MSDNNPLNIETPCIGICSTIYGDEVCRGCMRHYQEVIDWNSYQPIQKQRILHRLETEMLAVIPNYLEITDLAQLKKRLIQHAIAYRPERNPLCWAHSLLRQGADKMHDLSKYGLKARAKFSHLAPTELFEKLDDALRVYAQK